MLSTVFTLSSCDHNTYEFNRDELVENIARIELINYNNPEAKTIYSEDNILDFDFNKMVVIEVLDDTQRIDFLDEFSNIYLWRFSDFLNSPQAEAIRLVYENGSFEIISCYRSFSCRYNENGKPIEWLGDTGGIELVKIVNKYFDNQLGFDSHLFKQ